ncbi:pleiotropic drug resistance ABC transporter [Desarmillaria tabescens]|uniref:Pleiotropic drug resistance ABC transporter n=1 Tax=Armillaria tabescens TaxID=1929756 RepID=A0AA39JXU8_ARMTA|nr:pleiotropic drug resistance ABC transporter [Desarmillaria tabescens]KAK0449820.1 pleiotropic drug resistance ABC transporter [Desarmillaria tabescens]
MDDTSTARASSTLPHHRDSEATTVRVDVGHFDPDGMQDLRRTFSKRSNLGDDSASSSTIGNSEGFDFQKTLREFIRKRDDAQVKARELGVVFRNLRVVGMGASSSHQPTLGTALDPRSILGIIQKIRHPPVRDIISGFEGVVRPGEMLLVLGRPGSGCSTLLKTLANQRAEYHTVEGDVRYDSISPGELEKHYRGDVQYCPEGDTHFPTLTVEQTVSFAAKTRSPRAHMGLATSEDEYSELVTDVLCTVFGLRHARKTPIGNASIRGVSGGEKKRVSICEALAARSCIGLWDNSTRGLDSSTALEFVRALRIATDMMRLTTIVSIYQAGEPLYRLFDKVCVIYEGKMAYFGPACAARQYFIDLGYNPVNRQTTADFLAAVTDPMARLPRSDVLSIPRTAEDFARHFKQSQLGQENLADIAAYEGEIEAEEKSSTFKESVREEHAAASRKKSPYTISITMQARAVMLRKMQIMHGDMLAIGLTFSTYVIIGIIIGSVFMNSPETTVAFYSRGGVLFFVLLFSALTSMAEIPSLFSQRPIVERHKKAALYHPFVEATASTLVDIPLTFVTSIVFGVVVYFMVKLQQSAAQFFTFFLFIFVTSLAMKAWFRAISAACKASAPAQSLAGISILALGLYTGYTVPKPSMVSAFKWISYVNPLKYGFDAIMSNEFHTINGACSQIIPRGSVYNQAPLENQVCTIVGSEPGKAFVSGSRFLKLSYDYAYSNIWTNLVILIAFEVAYCIALFILTEYNTHSEGETSVVLFKPGTKILLPTSAHDEEKAISQSVPLDNNDTSEKAKQPSLHRPIFSWQHLQYTVPISGEEDRRLLDDVSGYVVPGKVTALMGESGAGKTTLLNVLAERITTGVVTGDRFVNGQSLPPDFQAQTGYCQQLDTHVPSATVREALLFSAKLRQPPSVPLVEKQAYVEECLKMCGLEAYADACVGSLSIEHRKRTTIGVELAAKPALLLFLDEPTSGLDSQSAWAIMYFLRQLADSGQAILCTIHQPSAELFQVFDRLLLLQKGGQTVYFGDLGPHSSTVIRYFETHGSRPCLPDENPAEFMLDVIGAGATAKSTQDWHHVWRESSEFQEVQRQIADIHTAGRIHPPVQAAYTPTSWLYQMHVLLHRNTIAFWRNPTYIMSKMVLNAIGGLFIGVTFYHSEDSQQGTLNKIFAVFIPTVLCVPMGGQIQVQFANMRSVYEIRERPSKMYNWSALVTAQILAEVPWGIFASSLLFCTWYWAVGFETSRAGYTYLMLGVLYPLYTSTFSQAIAAMAPRAEIATVLFSPFVSFVIIFNGVLQPYGLLGWWKWMYRLSPFTYLLEGIIGYAAGNSLLTCSSLEYVTLVPPEGRTCSEYMDLFIGYAGGYLLDPSATAACSFCPFRTSEAYLESNFNIKYDNHWRDMGVFVGFIVFNIIMVYVLTYFFRIRSGSLVPSFLRRK